ncbi:RNA polymerase sigma-70 factor (ECF subfamily) [Crossiella equi]|uniref:RNA polymerase sigma-70 factor (ECF subfamily) n=1 Tax=Crossiella equi TaxID=130796 RepID=A0ABS5ALY2_9PSEU|nr:sigma-70 family RNA polymerase sigma factor [Crossiella equi]MBP2477571.1 RNA polymerase sigma-70 factor (ECF subfamily) [Crossiella equi]
MNRDRRPAGGVTDGELVTQVEQGDRAAFSTLYDRYCRQAYALAKRVCVDAELAEDVVQEAFLTLWRDPGRYVAQRGGFGTWLLTIVHHRAVDAVRRENTQRKRTAAQAEQSLVTQSDAPGADVEAITEVLGQDVRQALRELTGEQREVIVLAYYGGYTQCEVAARTGLPLGTVKSRMFAAVRRLRGLLAGGYEDAGEQR